MTAASSDPGHEQSPYSIRAVERVCDLLDLLQESGGGVSLPAVAAATGLPKSSAFRYLSTLESRRYARRDATTGEYRSGSALQQASALSSLRVTARPLVEEAADTLGETVHLSVLEDGQLFHLVVAESRRSVRVVVERGVYVPLHEAAAGTAILAQIPPDEARGVLAEAAPDERRETLAQLDEVHSRGWALRYGEVDPDATALAVPVRLPQPSALGLVAPSSRLEAGRLPELARALARVAARLVDNAGGSRSAAS